jgi:hypothetical protein
MAHQPFGGTAPGMMPPSGYSNGRVQSPLMGEFGLSPVMQRPQFGGKPIPQIPQFGGPGAPINRGPTTEPTGNAYNSVMPPIGGNRVFISDVASGTPTQGAPSSQSAPPNVFQQSAGGLTGAMAGTQIEMGFNPQSVSQCLPMQHKQMPWGFRRHLYHRLDITRH